MIDFERVRHAYFNPPANDPPDHILTREEHIALHERRAVSACLASGGDPRVQGLGEHGSLIGGPGKPLRVSHFHSRPEYAGPWTPLPLPWFSRPAARKPLGPAPDDHPLLDHLIAAHLAGYPDPPTAPDLARILRSDNPTRRERFALYHILGCISPLDLGGLLSEEHLSLYELARAIHFSGIRRPQVIAWLHMFAVPPESPG